MVDHRVILLPVLESRAALLKTQNERIHTMNKGQVTNRGQGKGGHLAGQNLCLVYGTSPVTSGNLTVFDRIGQASW